MAFPGLMDSGFQVLLFWGCFFKVSDPVGFLFPVGTEPGARVGGAVLGAPEPKAEATTGADGRAALVEPEREAELAEDKGETAGRGGL